MKPDPRDGPIHGWFGLTYAQYLVLNRTILQSMPIRWQTRFVRMLDEVQETLTVPEELPSRYFVRPVDRRGRFVKESLPHYKHAPLLKRVGKAARAATPGSSRGK